MKFRHWLLVAGGFLLVRWYVTNGVRLDREEAKIAAEALALQSADFGRRQAFKREARKADRVLRKLRALK